MVRITFTRLRLWNIIIGLIQLATGATILGITDYSFTGKLPWYTFFIGSWTREDGKASSFYRPTPKQVANFPIGVFAGVFLLLSAADHLVVCLPGVNALYNRMLCSNRNPFRWLEYSVSASLMSVMIAQLVGMTDIHLLFTIGSLTASTMLFGWLMEVMNGERVPVYEYSPNNDPSEPPPLLSPGNDGNVFMTTNPSAMLPTTEGAKAVPGYSGGVPYLHRGGVDWSPFIMGWWPYLASLLVTACFFFQAVSKADPPAFVWTLFFILTALYCLFAVNQALQFKQVRFWRGFGRAEMFYMILSLTSKQLLAWINYGGTQRFSSEEF